MATVVVLGCNFAGLTSALETRRHLGDTPDRVIVVSRTTDFLFTPSLIWVPFGEREIADISLPVAPILQEHGIEFVHATATRIDPEASVVQTTAGQFEFDYLVIATGPELDWSVPGTGPDGHTSCICTPPDAMAAREAFRRFVDNPGPAVIGAIQGAGCTGAAYEFLFNFEDQLRRQGIRDRVELTWITPEPFLGHFGIGGMPGGEALLKAFTQHLGVRTIVNAEVERVEPGTVVLRDGRRLPFAYAMLMPPFLGQRVVRDSPGLGNPRGYVPVEDTYQHRRYPHIFAAGIAIDVPVPFATPVAVGVPKTGYPADVAGKTVGENIARLIRSDARLKERPFARIPGLCVMDAGHKEVVIVSNHLLKPRQFAVMIPNPIYDEGKRLFEKYFLWKTRHGYSFLP
jgi:sulfide:quinone oxidoreductase